MVLKVMCQLNCIFLGTTPEELNQNMGCSEIYISIRLLDGFFNVLKFENY